MNPKQNRRQCAACGESEPSFIHTVRKIHSFRRLCTDCLLKEHRGLFCSVCLTFFVAVPSPNARIVCLNCPSIAHLSCSPSPSSSAASSAASSAESTAASSAESSAASSDASSAPSSAESSAASSAESTAASTAASSAASSDASSASSSSDSSFFTCPPCSDPNFSYFPKLRVPSSDQSGNNDDKGSGRVIDMESAKGLVAAAEIAVACMKEASTRLQKEAVEKILEVRMAKMRAKDALGNLQDLVLRQSASENINSNKRKNIEH